MLLTTKPAFIAVTALAVIPFLFSSAFGANCIELGNCPININRPLDWLTLPYTINVGASIYPVIWGIILGMVYIKTEKAELVILCGVMVIAGFVAYNPTVFTNSSTGMLFYWGIVFACVAFGCTMFYLIKHRVNNPAM